jgi:hypothetical protein
VVVSVDKIYLSSEMSLSVPTIPEHKNWLPTAFSRSCKAKVVTGLDKQRKASGELPFNRFNLSVLTHAFLK